MSDTGALFYDRPEVFATYAERRQQATSANQTLELPIIQALLPELTGSHVLDLGCGDAEIAHELFVRGASAYTGVEASAKMLGLAQQQAFKAGQVKLEQGYIENWDYPSEQFELVLSRLAFHYVEAIEPVFELVARSLKPGGYFVFSVEHPVITSHQLSMKAGANRQDWAVDRYFDSGKRHVSWLGGQVLKYHRTVEDYFCALQQHFQILALRESRPDPKRFKDRKLFEKRNRVPLFLMFKAQKKDA